MTETGDHRAWSDERVESLLQEFFRNEMPQELQELPESPAGVTAHSRPRTSAASRRRGGWFGVATAATAVVAAVAALMLQSPSVDDRPEANGPEGERAAVAGEADTSPALDQLGRPGARGPVEMRSRNGIENVGTTESGLEIEYPEWEADIRVFPIDDDEPKRKK